MRHNRLIERLANGGVAFGAFAASRDPEAAIDMAHNRDVDFVFYDMEHAPFDIATYRHYLQWLLDPAAILARGRMAADPAVLVRIPAYGREAASCHWMVKQVLDQGAHGIIVPHIESAEQARAVMQAMRYPPVPEAPDRDPQGQRGFGAGNAARYWGMTPQEYLRKADVWPLDPEGELVCMLLIENQAGVANAEAIARTPGVTVVASAPGDLGVAYGGDAAATEQAIQEVRQAVSQAGVACMITAGPHDIARRLGEGFRVIVTTGPDALAAGLAAAGRHS